MVEIRTLVKVSARRRISVNPIVDQWNIHCYSYKRKTLIASFERRENTYFLFVNDVNDVPYVKVLNDATLEDVVQMAIQEASRQIAECMCAAGNAT